ncbi:MAG TPA: YcxB family protein [Thermoanaerobaculia bacterium]|nr:YcxB family protein [Thermoanaerobaculia bacterium]
MTFTFTITYNDALVTSAAARVWWRRIGIRYFVILALLLACEVALLVGGDRSWWAGSLGTLFVLGLALPFAGFFIQRHDSLQKSRALEAGRAEIVLSPAGLRFSRRGEAVEFPWSKLRHVVRYPEYWLVGPTAMRLFILSLDGFPAEAQDFMLQSVREHGGMIA